MWAVHSRYVYRVLCRWTQTCERDGETEPSGKGKERIGKEMKSKEKKRKGIAGKTVGSHSERAEEGTAVYDISGMA